MKVLAYIMLHYGRDYLGYTIQSLYDIADKIVILYTPTPTHNVSELSCPDTAEQLKQIARSYDKVEWYNIKAKNESEHLSRAFNYTVGYDVAIRLDSDEVWNMDELRKAVQVASQTDSRYIGIYGFIHFWRSFDWMNTDGFAPIRLHNLHSNVKENKFINSKVYHFGYAIREEMMRYKWSCHGHKTEIKSGWMRKWLQWEPGCNCTNLHPVTDAYWGRAEWYDKTTLPELLKRHPYYNLDIIQ